MRGSSHPLRRVFAEQVGFTSTQPKGQNGICPEYGCYRKKGQSGILKPGTQHWYVPLSIHHRRYELLRKHLRAVRRAAGLTQAELGNRLKMDQSYVSKVERGERYVDILFYLDWCRACKSRPDLALSDLIAAGA